jgi:rare lipoprotein A
VANPYAALFYPAIPETYTGKDYRVQVGAYKEFRYAEDAYIRLKNAGLNPEYERYGDFYRVVLPGLKQEELGSVSERLGRAGFREAMLREEAL